jgi:type IV fimbrial biogenesis protein FimT/type IV fimbrial biogenesis protein FimU
MSNILGTSSPFRFSARYKKGFTLIELMVAIAVVAILSAIALPSMNVFLVKMRVDNEISEMQKLLLTARNMAINTGKNTTVCPLTNGSCTNNWQNQISVFTNGSNNLATNNTFAAPDELIKIKEAIKTGDRLQFANGSVIYAPSGQLITANGTFSYCPINDDDWSRGIDLSISGRSYTSSDIDNDGKDEDRNGDDIVCSS